MYPSDQSINQSINQSMSQSVSTQLLGSIRTSTLKSRYHHPTSAVTTLYHRHTNCRRYELWIESTISLL